MDQWVVNWLRTYNKMCKSYYVDNHCFMTRQDGFITIVAQLLKKMLITVLRNFSWELTYS